MLAAPDRSSVLGRSAHALLLWLVRTGARVSGAIGINVVNLRSDPPYQVWLRGKGAKERVVPR